MTEIYLHIVARITLVIDGSGKWLTTYVLMVGVGYGIQVWDR